LGRSAELSILFCFQAFDALLASLDARGIRESHLQALLRKVEPLLKDSIRKKKLDKSMNGLSSSVVKTEASEVPSNLETGGSTDSPSSTICAFNSETPEPSTSFHIDGGRNSVEVQNSLRRFKHFEEWLWRECLSSSVLRATKYGKTQCTQLVQICECCRFIHYFKDKHCPTCHKTYAPFDKSFDYSEHVAQCGQTKVNTERQLHHFDCPPPRIRLLKALLGLVEVRGKSTC